MSPVSPDPAATVIVMRASSVGFEVLMVERVARGFFGGLVVFPGGRVDADDDSVATRSVTIGDFDDHDHRAAALRELAEETGIIVGADGLIPAPDHPEHGIYGWAGANSVSLATDRLVLASRWVTPEEAPRRFDTRFYLLEVDDPPQVRLDYRELVDHFWVEPATALDRHGSGEWPMFLPTIAHLRWLSKRGTIADALRAAEGADGRTLIVPRRVEDGSIVPVHLPVESA